MNELSAMYDLTNITYASFKDWSPVERVSFNDLNHEPKVSITLHRHAISAYPNEQYHRDQIDFFRDPQTGLFNVANFQSYRSKMFNSQRIFMSNTFDGYSVFDHLLQVIRFEVTRAWNTIFSDFKQVRIFDQSYLESVNNAVLEQINNRQQLLKLIDSQIRTLSLRPHPNFNQIPVFHDEKVKDGDAVTSKIDYDNPKNQHVTKMQHKRVNDFLNVLMTKSNADMFLWFLGGMLSNDETSINSLLLVSGNKDDNYHIGRHTFIDAILWILFDDHYQEHAALEDYFGNDIDQLDVDLDARRANLFESVNWSRFFRAGTSNVGLLKALLTDGIYNGQDEHGDVISHYYPQTNYIAIVDHLPDPIASITENDDYFLPLIMRSTSTYEKLIQLKLYGKRQLFDYLHDIRQDLANVAYQTYRKNPMKYSYFGYQKALKQNLISDMKQL